MPRTLDRLSSSPWGWQQVTARGWRVRDGVAHSPEVVKQLKKLGVEVRHFRARAARLAQGKKRLRPPRARRRLDLDAAADSEEIQDQDSP